MYARQISTPLPPAYAHFGKGWPEPEYEVLKAWDPVQQKEIWRLPFPGTQNGGILSTDGDLIFQGSSTGYLLVVHAKTGKLLKKIYTGTGIQAAPMSYQINGEQYVAVMAGYGGAVLFFPGEQDAVAKYKNEGRILAFKLGGKEVPLPPVREPASEVFAPPTIRLETAQIEKGGQIYSGYCGACHSSFGKSHKSELPDLSNMAPVIHETFEEIVLKGKLSYYGMSGFSDVLKKEEVKALHQFLISVQKKRYEEQLGSKR
jgi:quinohemoprotein ethanol dehydrogenase